MSSKEKDVLSCDRSDIYIMVPCRIGDGKNRLSTSDPTPLSEKRRFLEMFDLASRYECSIEIADKIHRSYLGDFDFACSNDSYETTFPKKLSPRRCLAKYRGSLFLSTHQETGLSVLFLCIPQVQYNITLLADQISIEYLYFGNPLQGDREQEEFLTWRDFLKQNCDITLTDIPRTLFVLPKQSISSGKLENILSGDADDGSFQKCHIRSRKVKSEAQNNIAVYDFYSAYCSSRFLALVLKDFSLKYADNYEKEIDMLFICELILFQIAAITRTNQEILDNLSSPKKLSLKAIEAMHTQFGKTVRLWNSNIFKYSQVQELASSIQTAFGIPELLDTYYRNQNYIEHTVNITRSISAEKEGKVINFFALLLATIQVVPILIPQASSSVSASLLCATILIALLWQLYRRNRTH